MRRIVIAALMTASTLGGLPPVPVMAQPPGQPMEDSSISIEFKGGTVADYVKALKGSGKAVNVVASERASKQQLAPVSLSQVSVGVAVYSIAAASTSASGNWRIDVISPPGPQFPGMHMGGQAYSVDFFPYGKRGEDVVVESYSLQRIISRDGKGEGLDPKVALTAIETGLKLQNEGTEQPPDLQFHADSGLLFVRGTNADVRLVGSIVSRMMDDAKARYSAAEKRIQGSALRSMAIREAQLDIEVREMELAAAQKVLEQARELMEKGGASAGDLQRFELEFGRARMNLERAKLGLERAQIMPIEGSEGPATEAPSGAPASTPPQAPGGATGKSTKRPSPK